MSLKAQLEAIIYAAETPITLEQMTQLVKDTVVAEGVSDEAEIKSRVRSSLEELVGEYGAPDHGIEIRAGRRRIPHVDQAGAARSCACVRQEPEAADPAVAASA